MVLRALLPVVAACLLPATALGQDKACTAPCETDGRPAFDLKALQARHFVVDSRAELAGVGQGLEVVVLSRPTPEGAGKGLDRVARLFVLSGGRVEFDSFEWDGVGDAVEPGVNSKTFFGVKWSVARPPRARKGGGLLVLTGVVPLQDPGEPIRTGSRVLVLSYNQEAGFDQVLDGTGARPAVVGSTDVRFPL